MEALVALAVFAVGLAVLMPTVVATVRANDSAAVRSRATSLAQQWAEEIRGADYDWIRGLAADPPAPQTVDGIFTVVLAFPPTPALQGDEDDLTRVLVTVRWARAGRGAGAVSLVTARGRY